MAKILKSAESNTVSETQGDGHMVKKTIGIVRLYEAPSPSPDFDWLTMIPAQQKGWRREVEQSTSMDGLEVSFAVRDHEPAR